MFIHTIARVYSAVKYVVENHSVISQCMADLDGLVRDYDTFAHVTKHPVVVSDVYCATFASAIGEYIVMSIPMYAMYMRGENTDLIDALVKHEDGHHALGHTSLSTVAIVAASMTESTFIQREYEADEYSHNAGYAMIDALEYLYNECASMYGDDSELCFTLAGRIDRLNSLNI